MAAMPDGPNSTMVDWECDDYIHIRPCRHGVDLRIFKGTFTIRAQSANRPHMNRAERRKRTF